jgi:hypothetical protein
VKTFRRSFVHLLVFGVLGSVLHYVTSNICWFRAFFFSDCVYPNSRTRERVRTDSKGVEAKRKCWGRSVRHFVSGGGGKKERLIVRRFPGNARSSF